MKIGEEINYKCPYSGEDLVLTKTLVKGDDIIEGFLTNSDGITFPIEEGIVDLTWPRSLAVTDKNMRETYEKLANEYYKYADLPFRTFQDDQHAIRLRMLQMMNLNPNDKVLEVGCGDGRGAEYIADFLNEEGALYLQELSRSFLKKAIERIANFSIKKEFSVANASYLSFSDNFFDAAHHFGGINTFGEIQRCLKELARVVKPGGKIVFGDEGIAPWLRNTEMAKIMMNSNPLMKSHIPLDMLPVEARNVKVEWICQGAFYIIEFSIGVGEPEANYKIPIPSVRGGSHWTRYYGNLEGVTDEVKELALKARDKAQVSMHDWLDNVVREAAKRELE